VYELLATLSVDSMEGRRTGEPGELGAARVIAAQMQASGLEPAGDSSFFQRVPMAITTVITERDGQEFRRERLTLMPDFAALDTVEWPELIARMKAAMQRDADPQGEEVQALAKRWRELIEMFTGGDAGITQSPPIIGSAPCIEVRRFEQSDLIAPDAGRTTDQIAPGKGCADPGLER
jgi:hypothetical protein